MRGDLLGRQVAAGFLGVKDRVAEPLGEAVDGLAGAKQVEANSTFIERALGRVVPRDPIPDGADRVVAIAESRRGSGDAELPTVHDSFRADGCAGYHDVRKASQQGRPFLPRGCADASLRGGRRLDGLVAGAG